MSITLYAEINFLCIVIAVMLSFMMWRINKSGPQRLMITVFLSQAFLFLLDFIWVFIDGNPRIPHAFNYAVNMAYYEMTALSPLLWAFFCGLSLSGREYSKKWTILFFVPITVLTVFLVISPYTGSIFYIDAENCFHRGPLYFIQPIIGYLYLGHAGGAALWYAHRAKTYAERKRAEALALFVAAPVTAAVLQIVFPGLPLICAGSTVSMIAVFMNLQEQLITQDTLTKMNNRFQLMNYLERKLERLQSADADVYPLYVYMLDIDDFKKINDSFGHLEGDRALMLTADAIKRTCGKYAMCFCARFGGDEFAVAYEAADREQAELLAQEIRQTVSGIGTGMLYSLGISIGMVECRKGTQEKAGNVLDRADEELYKDKTMKKRRSNNGNETQNS